MTKLTDLILEVTRKELILKKYSEPRIFCGGGDIKDFLSLPVLQQKKQLQKDWYVTFTYRNPKTGLMEEQPRIKRGNNFKTFKKRYETLEVFRKGLSKLLKEGYNPYALLEENESDKISVRNAFDQALEIKQKTVSTKYHYDLSTMCRRFIEYLDKHNHNTEDITEIRKPIINKFLKHLLTSISIKTRNDFKTGLNGIFSELEKLEIIEDNFISTIPTLKRTKKRSRTYSSDQVKTIFGYLEDNDKQLLLFIKMVSYVFLRPIEIVRLRVSDIDLKNKLIEDKTKTSALKTKIIPSIIYKDLEQYILGKPDMYLFTKNGVGYWDIKEETRRAHFTRKYNTVRKNIGISEEYNIYSFRHTAVTQMYKYLRKQGLSKTNAIDEICLITGHNSKAVLNYIHVLDAELPEDYSDGFKM